MLQAMNTGHDGSLATIHANSPRDVLSRLETMVSMAGLNIPDRAIRHQITSAIHVVIQLARLSDGSRKMMNLNEIVGMEGEMITMQEIFSFDLLGVTEDRRVKGNFITSGIRPKFMKRLEAMGIQLPVQVFQETS
jgi:pilus assembly protein CpaF